VRSGAALAVTLGAVLAVGAGSFQEPAATSLLPRAGQAGDWSPSAPPERYARESLYGYLDGGAELFLPYGFQELAVGRYKRTGGGGSEMTVEIYRTETSLDAFGLFSLQRDGSEEVSSSIVSPHWLGAGQAGLVKGRCYVNLAGYETRGDELEAMLRAVEALLPGRAGTDLDPRLGVLPAAGRAPRSERFIKGEGAARAETQFFSDPVWGFGRGATAVSARYEPGGLKLIVVEVPLADEPAALDAAVRAQFAAHLESSEVLAGGLAGRNGSGQTFLYARHGRTARLVWGKDEAAAAALLRRAAR
jgi:hypothetical protein